ncbi:sialoadhesin-like isoform X2 [Labeo rohita]|uniref:Sialoadhesin-like isoform X2 n=1 Tax=Labeo rohita TaxID=84645 RepID=A0A498NZV6_LABRO|nr:sialoadhesin-like isoform X2 [Labeo rohita]
MGDTITVECSTFHTCPYSKPSITLNGIEGSNKINEESIKDGLWKITLTRTSVVKAESTTIKCSVTHYGGITVTATEVKRSKCVHQNITIEPELADVTEGVAKNFICSVYHSCQNENPTITWNYKNMQVTKWRRKLYGLNRISYSNITFLGAKEDYGKKLICTATFSGGDVSASVVLRVQQYQKPIQILNETYFQYVADVIPKITALPRSCVVIPCSFKMEEKYLTQLWVHWVTEKGGYMFHTNPSNILDNFKGRTRLLGNLNEQNCTVEMDNVRTHDNGPFCFRAERENIQIQLQQQLCVHYNASHNHMGGDVWETVSAVTFIPTGYEEKDEIVCTAKFWGGETQENTAFLSIRNSLIWICKAHIHNLNRGVLLYVALGWKVRMPKDIHGLKGSCLVIPCSFNYTAYPPANPRRVVWYQWVSSGYPLVYDPRSPNDVIKKFRGKTDLYGDPSSRDCSLLIKNLELSHNGEKIYAWIDPENVGWRTYKFYDVTSTIQVDASPQQPSINLYGGERTGDNITVACSTFHTCPYSKPNITLNGIEGSDTIKDESFKDGLWQTTLTRTGVIKAENSTIECSATHHGGITVTATKNKSAQCVHHKIMIEPELGDVTEGVAKNFICSVYHSCQNENPTITWNYENMQDTKGNKKLSSLNQVTYSNITFLGANKDDGKKLICTANFSGGTITTSVVLHVQCVHHNISIEPELADVTEGVAKNFICSVYHSCQKENPSITWNFENMQDNDYEAEYTNMDELNMYGNI